MDVSTDLLVVLSITLVALLFCARFTFWVRRWRTTRWLDEFERSFAELETKSELCTDLASRCFHTLSKTGRNELYDVSSFVTQVQDALLEWRTAIHNATSIVEVERLCDQIDDTLADITGGEYADPIVFLMARLQRVAIEITAASERAERINTIIDDPHANGSTRRQFEERRLAGNETARPVMCKDRCPSATSRTSKSPPSVESLPPSKRPSTHRPEMP